MIEFMIVLSGYRGVNPNTNNIQGAFGSGVSASCSKDSSKLLPLVSEKMPAS